MYKSEKQRKCSLIFVEKRFNDEKLNMLNILKAMVRKDVNVIINTSREIRGKMLVQSQTGIVWEK